MSRCRFCHRDGLVFIRCLDVEGYVVAACSCPLGTRWRVKWQLRAFTSTLLPPPIAIGRLEDWFTEDELKTFDVVEAEHMVRDGKECIGR